MCIAYGFLSRLETCADWVGVVLHESFHCVVMVTPSCGSLVMVVVEEDGLAHGREVFCVIMAMSSEEAIF